MTEKKESIYGYLLGTPDRKYAFVSVSLGVISIVLTAYLWKFPETIPELIILRDIVVFIILLLVSGLLLYKYIRREAFLIQVTKDLKESNTRLYKQFDNFHSITHKFRNHIFSHYINAVPDDILVGCGEKDSFEKICRSITMDVKNVLNNLYEAKNIDLCDSLAVTVKLTLSSKNILDLYGSVLDKALKKRLRKNQQWVITVYRDPDTYDNHKMNREVGRCIYSVERNTAFIHIFQDREQIFASDDLQALGSAYKNESVNWKDLYNATIVAPIRYISEDHSNYRCFGYISADSLNSEKLDLFENEEAKFIMGHVADLMANYFLTLSLAKQTMKTVHEE